MKIVLLMCVLGVTACSARQTPTADERSPAATDPFNDPFFTQSLAGDEDGTWRQDEGAAEQSEKPETPKTMLEQSEGVLESTLVIGASLAKMLAIPFLF